MFSLDEEVEQLNYFTISKSLNDWVSANSDLSTQRSSLATWEPPLIHNIKVNIDGSYITNTSQIAARGLVRDHRGTWIRRFTSNLGSGSACSWLAICNKKEYC